MLSEFPKFKLNFVGDEEIQTQAISGHPRFQKSGSRYIRKMHTLVATVDATREFKKHVIDVVDRHKKRYHVDPLVEHFEV